MEQKRLSEEQEHTTIGVLIKSKVGFVLATDSRTTGVVEIQPGKYLSGSIEDKAVKLFSFSSPHNFIGAINYGLLKIGEKSVDILKPEFEARLPSERLTVFDFAQQFSNFLLEQWQASMPDDYALQSMFIVVGGYNNSLDKPYGEIYSFDIPRNPTPVETPIDIVDKQGNEPFGIVLLGTCYIIDRLIQGYDNRLPANLAKLPDLQAHQVENIMQVMKGLWQHIPMRTMSLAQCEELAKFFIRTTIDAQKYTVAPQTCGDPIVLATIKRQEGFKFILPPP